MIKQYRYVKTASLDSISQAVGAQTIDELREARRLADIQHEEDMAILAQKLFEKTGVRMTGKRRKAYKKTMEKAGLDIFGNELEVKNDTE
jgi:hypothetical protein